MPVIEAGRDGMLFDGDCGICTAFARMARRCDRKRRFQILPYQLVAEEELQRFGTSRAQCRRRLHVLTRRGKVHTGAIAVNYFFWHQRPWSPVVAVLYVLPFLLLLEMGAYALVSRHRQKLSQWLGLPACAVREWQEIAPAHEAIAGMAKE